jgi:GTPase SAR1 family protein
LKVWDLESGRELRTLEGHTEPVYSVALSSAGRRAVSASHDNTLKVWDLERVFLEAPEPSTPHVQYTNAKVVLVGDATVGKTGLALVLTGQEYAPTDSTHGRHVWTLESYDEILAEGHSETRETLLWDLAGQPGYRLIHQLHLSETTVALVVFDARSETDPFAGVRHWDRALRLALRVRGDAALPMKRYLVAARTDRGALGVSQGRIDSVVRDLGFDGYFETSAKEGWNVAELAEAVRKAIDWNELPKVNSSELFQSIKAFLLEEKKAKRLLSTADDLYRAFLKSADAPDDSDELRAQFETCIGRVESRGLIRRLNFGDFVLLQPELLDAYASSMVNAAKEEPDGLGCIAEEDALAGRFKMPTDERVTNKEQEKLLLIATVEELLRYEITLKEVSNGHVDLVFPSQFTRELPAAPDMPGKAVVFTFDGPVLNIYTTLAVRLSHSHLFEKKEMWKNAARYEATVGGTCGLYLRELQEGQGELTLCYDDAAAETTRVQFEDYVDTHLRRRALADTMQRRRIFECPGCRVKISDEQAQLRRSRGFDSIRCNVCETEISLLDREERLIAEARPVIAAMDESADARRDLEVAAMTLKGKIESGDYDVFLCHNSKDKPAVKEIGERLKERGILPWLDEWELQPGEVWIDALDEIIGLVKTAAVFVGPHGCGRWEKVETRALLRKFVEAGLRVIPVLLKNARDEPDWSLFLDDFQRIDFRKEDPDPLRQLIWGITGERPDRYA